MDYEEMVDRIVMAFTEERVDPPSRPPAGGRKKRVRKYVRRYEGGGSPEQERKAQAEGRVLYMGRKKRKSLFALLQKALLDRRKVQERRKKRGK